MSLLLSEGYPNLTPEQIEDIGNLAKELVIANIGGDPNADSARTYDTANGTVFITAGVLDGEKVDVRVTY